jgi:hypothetical protein
MSTSTRRPAYRAGEAPVGKYGIEVLVAHFGATAIEGSADSLVILRVESEEV